MKHHQTSRHVLRYFEPYRRLQICYKVIDIIQMANRYVQIAKVLLQRRSAQDISFPASNDCPKHTPYEVRLTPNTPNSKSCQTMAMEAPRTPNTGTPMRCMRCLIIIATPCSTGSKFNLASPLFSTYSSRVIAAQIAVRRTLLCPTSILPMLPCLSLTQTIRSAIGPIVSPGRM